MNGLMAVGIASGVVTALAILAIALTCTLNMAQQNLKDAALKITLALPNGAATTTAATGIDTQKGASGQQVGVEEYLLSAPACTTGELGDAQVITRNIKTSDNANLSGSVQLIGAAIVQTGAGGAGDVAKTYRFRLPSDAKRYIFWEAVKTGASNASTKSDTLEVVV